MKSITHFFLLLLIIPMAFADQCGQPIPIIQKPITFNAERIALTREYRRVHYGIDQKSITIEPKIIVLHATDASFADTLQGFMPAKLDNRTELIKGGLLNVSVQFLVNKDGAIYQLMPENWMARHIIGLDNNAIGIENAGRADGKDLTAAQLTSDVYLVCLLKQQYPTIEYLIGHYEYYGFRNSSLWLEKNKNYMTYKVDPGPKFTQAVRERVKNLNFHKMD